MLQEKELTDLNQADEETGVIPFYLTCFNGNIAT